MNIQEQIDAIVEEHKKVMAEHSGISSIRWDIKDISYADLEAWRNAYNEANATNRNEHKYISKNTMGDRIFLLLNPWTHNPAVSGCDICLLSVPVKFKTHIEVIEEVAAE